MIKMIKGEEEIKGIRKIRVIVKNEQHYIIIYVVWKFIIINYILYFSKG